jgi:RHS repeat-associated protein
MDPATNVLKILEENHYYPFGLKHSNYNSNIRTHLRETETEPKHVAGTVGTVYDYKYNGKEWQDELGLNVTAMDFRQYDPAIGRFYGMDRLSELGYSITPYRFAYNNPIYWSDPTGLFESKDDAKKYAKSNGIRTGWFSRNKVEQNQDGSWSINNRKNGTTTFAASSSDANSLGVAEGDVVTSVLLVAEKKENKKDPLDVTIWGTKKDGESGGREGTATHSLKSTDLITPGNSRPLNNKNFNLFEWFLSLFKNSIDTTHQATTLHEVVNRDSNTSSMEVKNEEPVIVEKSIEVITYEFHVNDSTVTQKREIITLRGESEKVEKRLDSIKRRNDGRKSTRDAYLKDWGKK